jgi:glyoxylase-like metal-dependent hydrolase (beta-lactamase superfamily II)
MSMEAVRIDQDMTIYKGGGSNSVVLRSRDGCKAIVVDTKYFRGARQLRQQVVAQEIVIINTHFHLDHARGNRYYPDAFVISGATNWKQWDFDTAHSKRPDKALAAGETARLECDDEIIDVIDLGPAHSPNDIVVYFRKRKLLATGDLVWIAMHPVLLDANKNLEQWKSYLDKMDRDLEIDTVVPGHGDLSGKDAIQSMKSYFESIENALGDKAHMKELKEKYRAYKRFPLFGSLRRTAGLLAVGKGK